MEQQDAGGAWVTVAEAAGLLGVSTQAIRKRIARGTIDVRRNNRGQEVVQAVPASGPRTRQPVPKEVAVRTQPEPQPDGTASGHVSLDDARAMVAEACERQERAHDRNESAQRDGAAAIDQDVPDRIGALDHAFAQ